MSTLMTTNRSHHLPQEDAEKSAQFVELRARPSKNNGLGGDRHFSPPPTSSLSNASQGGNRTIVEHVVRVGDTLNSIALQYSCTVADVKRANNLTADQDVYALPVVKVPLSRLQKVLLEEKPKEASSAETTASTSLSSGLQISYPHHSQLNSVVDTFQRNARHDRRHNKESTIPLLNDYDDHNLSDDSMEEMRKDVNGILGRVDANCASVREQLPSSPSRLYSGAFHFVDANAPSDHTSKGICMLVLAVVFIFVIVPLFFTFEEVAEEKAHSHNSHYSHNSGV